jgi:hypothetical protein
VLAVEAVLTIRRRSSRAGAEPAEGVPVGRITTDEDDDVPVGSLQ